MRKEKKKEEEGEEKVKLGILTKKSGDPTSERKKEGKRDGEGGWRERRGRQLYFQQNNVSDIKQTHGKMAQRGVCMACCRIGRREMTSSD